jgi:hypothetical protein
VVTLSVAGKPGRIDVRAQKEQEFRDARGAQQLL